MGKIRLLKLLLLFVISIVMTNCKDADKSIEISKNNKISKDEFNLEGHTFFKVTETDSGKVLFKPCGASKI